MVLDPRKARIATNEASFRDINERLEQDLRKVRHAPEVHPFVCECGNDGCEDSVGLTLAEYEAVRRDSRHFAVKPGHVFPEAENVVESHERYEVVEKKDEAAPISDATDRRTPGIEGLRESE